MKTYKNKNVSLTWLTVMLLSLFILYSVATPDHALAAGNTYYVSTSGNNDWDGLSPTYTGGSNGPWATPSYSARQAVAEDTIYLLDGTWNDEHVVFANSGTAGNPITITAYDGTPTLDGNDYTGSAIEIGSLDYINISGLKFTRYRNGIHINQGTHNRILNSTFYDFGHFEEADHYPVYVYMGDYTVVDNCEAYDCPTGIYFTHSTYLTITNNYIHDCWGAPSSPGSDCGISVINDAHHCLIDNNRVINTVNQNGRGGNCIWIGRGTYNHHITISNNEVGVCGHNCIDVHENFHDIIVINNTVYEPHHRNGIYMVDGPNNYNNQIINNTVYDVPGYAIVVGDSDYTEIKGNTVYDCDYGISMFHDIYWPDEYTSDYQTVINNTIYSCGTMGIYVGRSNHNLIENNKVSDSGWADYFIESNSIDNTILNMANGTNKFNIYSSNNVEITVDFTDGRTFKLDGDAGGHTSVTLTGADQGTHTIEIEGASTGTISGTVIDANTTLPIEGATVIVEGMGLSKQTDFNGIYTIHNVPVRNDYAVTCTKTGYQDGAEDNVVVSEDATRTVDFTLTPKEPDSTPPAFTLKTITINGGVDDATVTEVEINGVSVTVTSGAYSHQMDVSSTDTITIIAENGGGKNASRTVTIK